MNFDKKQNLESFATRTYTFLWNHFVFYYVSKKWTGSFCYSLLSSIWLMWRQQLLSPTLAFQISITDLSTVFLFSHLVIVSDFFEALPQNENKRKRGNLKKKARNEI